MNGAPGIPQDLGEMTSSIGPYDPLNATLNSVHEIPYGTPSFNRDVIWTNGDVGLPDETYAVGYKQVPVDNQVTSFVWRTEAPDVPVTHTPFMEQLYNSTLVFQSQGDQILYSSLRAPGINEGN